MGLKLSTNNTPRPRTYSGSSPGRNGASGDMGELAVASGSGARSRARSLGTFQTSGHPSGLSIPSAVGYRSHSPDSDSSSPDDSPFQIGRPFTQSLPVHLFALQGIKCPVCSKFVQPDDIECHLVMCLTKPRISYNEDVLADDKGECVICFEDLQQGDTIARLPCLCIYHKGCIDKWFEVNRSCPEHPSD